MLTRDRDFIQKFIYIKDSKIYCKEKCIIEFPKWYEEKGLAEIGEEVNYYGIFSINIGEKYSVSIIPTLCISKPIMINEIEREDVKYIQLIFGKDDCILENNKVIKHGRLSYNFFETFFLYARVPWFVEYEDLVKIMDNAKTYAGSGLGDNYIANELITSFITRSKKDKRVFYRQINGVGEKEYVDLMNPFYSVKSNLNKLAGSYFNNSLVSAIVQPNKNSSKLEELVR